MAVDFPPVSDRRGIMPNGLIFKFKRGDRYGSGTI